MKILFLSRWFPFPTNNGSKLRIYNLLRGLDQFHDVTLLSFTDQPKGTPEAAEVRSVCREVHTIPWRDFDPNNWRARLAFFSLKPRSIVDTFSPEMAQKITSLLKAQKFDLIIASQFPMAAYFPYFGDTPALFEELELGLSYGDAHDPTGGWKKRLRHTLTWFKLRRYFSQLLDVFQTCTVVSEKERQLVQQIFPANKKPVVVIPNCVSMKDYENIRVEPKPNQLVFTGSFRYHTNYEAMLWFVRDVFPMVLEQVPQTQLIITGDNAGLALPPCPNITLAGYVDEIASLIASSTVSLAPLWSGGGTRLKILEAMALGTPVVATSKGAEGLDGLSGEHLFVADDPRQFAEHVIHLLRNVELQEEISSNARRLVREKYDWATAMPKLLGLLEQVQISDPKFSQNMM
jgi:glycosyltransferase involved in cell wall biosynthesis